MYIFYIYIIYILYIYTVCACNHMHIFEGLFLKKLFFYFYSISIYH